jgi:small subunit ribosomal protein S17
MAETAEKMNKERGQRRTLKGTVISTKMDKTVVVKVERKKRHPLYLKIVRIGKKYHAHDEHEICNVGDFILISDSRPISKTKRWRVKEIITKAK